MELDNTNITTGDAGTTPKPENKTFSQDDLNRIVSERLSKERAKAESDIQKREQDLQQREFLLTARTTLTERGLPVELSGFLNLSDPEAFEKGLEILDNYIKSELKKTTETAKPKPPPGALYGGRKETGSTKSDGIRSAMGLQV